MLTRRHYTRLRFYWQGRNLGGGSLSDNLDLDLAAACLIERRDHSASRFFITPAGIAELHAEKEREIARRQPHHDLGARLAAYLRQQKRVTWENIAFDIPREGGGKSSARPDVFSMACTYDTRRMNPAVHEVKVSRGDFLADVANPEKRALYARIAEVVYYAAPVGLIRIEELPPDCGLIVETEVGVFQVLKKPKRRPAVLSPAHFMNLVLKPGTFNSLL